MSEFGPSRNFAAAQQLRRFESEADIDSRRDFLGCSFACISGDDMFRKHRHIVPGAFLIGDPAINRPELAERLANFHPNINNVPLPKRGDVLLAERSHAGTASLSLRSLSWRKSARAINA